MTDYDIHFHWDPVCPFAWITSRWVENVVARRDYSVDWRFISLRILNKNIDYDAHFPPDYEEGHTAGLRLLRVAAAVRAEHGRPVMGPLYTALGRARFDTDPPDDRAATRRMLASPEFVEGLLHEIGLPTDFASALDDESFDAEIEAETDEALLKTGRDVGTPIIHFEPPDGVAFFGPVISRVPTGAEAEELWDHVIALARFPGFAEMKRSLRERLQLRSFGVDSDDASVEQDWHQGSRRLKK